MEIDGVSLLSYQEVLETIEGQENHLLLGNGFNKGLGIDTSYSAIFQKMIENNHGIFKDVANLVKECDFDLEKFIGELENDIEPENIFLRKYINNKIKMDFMQATHEIVKSEIKNIYAEKNDGVFILLKQFTNYFTLNYDSFLYLLLLNYKSLDTSLNTSFSLQPSLKFVQEDLNIRHNEVYNEIKQIRNGSLSITIDPDINPTKTPIDKVTKSTFTTIIKQYAKSNQKKWKTKIISQVVTFILEEEKKNQVLKNVDDGAQLELFQGGKEFVFDLDSNTQNLFFLHGAFHIYKDGKSIKKITQQTDNALYDRLESILNNDEQEIVCVFQSENKLEAIKQNKYLEKCYEKLLVLSGNFVILGSALSDNDNHLFGQINKSNIKNVYISSMSLTADKVKVAKSKFPDKHIAFFDVNTITYKQPEEN